MFTFLEPTPIFNRQDLENVFSKDALLFDEEKLLRALEFIALENTAFNIVKASQIYPHILEIKIPKYSSNSSLYFDKRFLHDQEKQIQEVKISKESVLDRLWNFPKCIYVWGGNYVQGIEKIANLYPVNTTNSFEKSYSLFQGVDCSGLYYEVLQATIPRNTKELISYGKQISLNAIEPLDILIWPGHMVIALDQQKVIESRLKDGGVIIRDLKERIDMIDHPFQVRRII